MKQRIMLAAALVLASCEAPEPDAAERERQAANQAAAAANPPAAPPEPEPEPEPELEALEPDPPGTRWETGASGEGASLILLTLDGERRLTLFCRPRSGGILVNVPRFRAGGRGAVMRLSAEGSTVDLDPDAAADRRRGGVSGTVALGDGLSSLLRSQEPIFVSYGLQSSGPHRPMMPEIALNFISTCRPAPEAAR